MKKNMLWVALAALLIPSLIRGLWFYRGFINQPKIATPDYAALVIPQIPLETPDTVTNEEIKRTNDIVLLDYAHVNQYQSAEVQSLKEAIEKRGGHVETLTDAALLELKLKYASAYVVISPSVAFSALEARIVQTFVERGGRLLVFADATRGLVYYDFFSGATNVTSDASAANPLLAPFGITISNDYLYNVEENEGNFRNVFFSDFGKDELTFGLQQVALYGTHSVRSPSGLVLLRGTESTLSSIDDAHDSAEGGAVLGENGNVIAFGDFTFLTSPYKNVADNASLITNIADFALGGEQVPSLANFPYIFTQSIVQVYPSSELQLTAETISAISKLQLVLQSVNINIEIADQPPRDGNALILGTFTPSDDLINFIKPFNIDMEDSEFVDVPNFGNIGRAGNGILLFKPNKTGNILTLLAETPEDLIVLLDTLSSGSLYGCVLQSEIGICSIGYGGSYSSEDIGEGTATEEPTSEEATPEATSTPSG